MNVVTGIQTEKEARDCLFNAGIEALRKQAGFIPNVTDKSDDTDYHIFFHRERLKGKYPFVQYRISKAGAYDEIVTFRGEEHALVCFDECHL